MDRTVEHLSYSDRGVHLLRRLVSENIEKVQQGQDPLALVRDPDHEMIDTNLLGEAQGVSGDSRPIGIVAETVPAGG